MNVRQFVEKVTRDIQDGAKAAMGDQFGAVSLSFKLTLDATTGDVLGYDSVPTPPQVTIGVDGWPITEEEPSVDLRDPRVETAKVTKEELCAASVAECEAIAQDVDLTIKEYHILLNILHRRRKARQAASETT